MVLATFGLSGSPKPKGTETLRMTLNMYAAPSARLVGFGRPLA